jgi:exodeoxyribonuclease V beta subunit
MNRFDHLQIDLAGSNLIEASAGTGKTYAIACLYLRLVVEQGLTPEQVLVVTFTEAATAELRDRIRRRLREALEALAGGPTNDPFLAGLRDNANDRGPDRATACRRLELALRSFDLAAIQTIHGFCLRVLQENAFESGSLYDTELVTDQTAIIREIVDDFWRTSFFGSSAPLLSCALNRGESPDSLTAFLTAVLGSPKQRIVPAFTAADLAALDERIALLFARVAGIWSAEQGAIEEILFDHPGLSRSADNYREDVIAPLIPLMAAYAAGGNPCDMFPGFARFTTAGIAGAALKKHPSPEHPFFDRCSELAEAVEQRFLALRWRLLEYARERLPERKQELNVRCFDDLLTDLWLALGGECGTQLAESVRSRYRAALIDEFQDTDPVQYDIFRRVYGGTDLPLFLIGDPKQAIYSFRGADIFAYLQAVEQVPAARRFTLDTNWRSAPGLLDAVNRLFGSVGEPFVFDRIAYHPVLAGEPALADRFRLSGNEGAPFQAWFVQAPAGSGEVNVGTANQLVPGAVATEIARLLDEARQGRGLCDGRPLLPEDMAVIVRSHYQAGLMQDALRALGIPGVLRSPASVFATAEARETYLLVDALSDPGSEPRLRAALVTDLLGRTGDDLALLLADETAWEEQLARFREYHELWQERGFMVMARLLAGREGIRGRLLGLADGERRLTNFFQCLEILHQAGLERRLGPEGLLTWFRQQLTGGKEQEEYQLRLETDEKAVKIVTVHLAKGLEYPVVFCPFVWGGVRSDDGVVTCHDGFTAIKDFGSPDLPLHRARADKEALAENLRLLYVAVTRAKYRCYLVGGRLKGAETSALAWLFHRPDGLDAGRDDLVARLRESLAVVGSETLRDRYAALAAGSGGAIDLADLPTAGTAPCWTSPAAGKQAPACRRFAGRLEHDWRVASFTSFAAAGHRLAGELPFERPDRDGTAPGELLPAVAGQADDGGPDMFAFPRGARAGTMLHEVFEKLDFTAADGRQTGVLIQEGLERYGFDARWQEPVRQMVQSVVRVPLPAAGTGFALADLQAGRWQPELEFFFPLALLTAPRLRSCLAGWMGSGLPADLAGMLPQLAFSQVRGMVHGFIDLVFEHDGKYCLVDWKSNWLGNRPEDYARELLAREMVRKMYPLQYLLYTVALDRYLALRVPGYDYDRHFGGVYYLFLRGMDPRRGAECGVFFDRPPRGLIAELTGLLVAHGALGQEAAGTP